jgi:multidrug resistance efflux pump
MGAEMSKIMQLADAYAFHIPGSSYSAEDRAALQAEVERMEDSAETLRYEMDALQAEVTRARNDERIAMAWLSDARLAIGKDCDFPTMVQEISELREDAERYRWLRSTTNFATNSKGERIDVRNIPEKWDEAIDAARSKQ